MINTELIARVEKAEYKLRENKLWMLKAQKLIDEARVMLLAYEAEMALLRRLRQV